MVIRKCNKTCDESFQVLKNAVTSAPVLSSPDRNKPFRGHINASKTAVRSNFTQQDEQGMDQIILFFSSKLTPAKEN